MRNLLLLVAVSATLLSCATSTREFVDEAVGYSVTRGDLVYVRGLAFESRNRLADGTAVTISTSDCEISLRLGERNEVISAKPNSVLVFGPDDDYLLQPYAAREAP